MSLSNLNKLAKITDISAGGKYLKNIDVGIPELNVALRNKNFNFKNGKAYIGNISISSLVKNYNTGNMNKFLRNLDISPNKKIVENLLNQFEKTPLFNVKVLNDTKLKMRQVVGADLDLKDATRSSIEKAVKSNSTLSKIYNGVGSLVLKGTTIALLGGIGTFTGLLIDAMMKYKDAKTGCMKLMKDAKGIRYCKIISASCCNQVNEGATCTHPDKTHSYNDCQNLKSGCCVKCDSTIVDKDHPDYIDPDLLGSGVMLMCMKPTLFDALIDLGFNFVKNAIDSASGWLDKILALFKSPEFLFALGCVVVILFLLVMRK